MSDAINNRKQQLQQIMGLPDDFNFVGAGYEYEQTTPSALWTIPHNLNRHPKVVTVDNQGNEHYGDIKYIDKNIVQAIFGAPIVGFAYCI